jgi:hypothetical protein
LIDRWLEDPFASMGFDDLAGGKEFPVQGFSEHDV